MNLEQVLKYAGVIISACFAIVGFIIFFTYSAMFWKSMMAAVMVFFLTWLSYTTIRWIFEMF